MCYVDNFSVIKYTLVKKRRRIFPREKTLCRDKLIEVHLLGWVSEGMKMYDRNIQKRYASKVYGFHWNISRKYTSLGGFFVFCFVFLPSALRAHTLHSAFPFRLKVCHDIMPCDQVCVSESDVNVHTRTRAHIHTHTQKLIILTSRLASPVSFHPIGCWS